MTKSESIPYPRFRWLVLTAACLGSAAMQIDMIAYAPLLGAVAKDLRIDMGAATNLMAVFLFTTSIAFLVGGFLCDRYGIMFVIILGLLCASVPAASMPWIGTSYRAVLWARVVQGFSAGFLLCTMAPIVAVWFPLPEKGLASGLMSGFVSLGSAIGVLAAPAVFLASRNWQQTAALLSLLGWLVLPLAFGCRRTSRAFEAQSQSGELSGPGGTAFKQALSTPITWGGVLVTFFSAWCLQTFWNLTPTYFAIDKPIGIGFGPMLSGKLMLAVMIAGMIGPVIGGLIQDKFFRGNAKPILLIGFILSGLFTYAILSPVVYTNMVVLVVCLILVGSGVAFLYPALVVIISGVYPIHIVGKMIGLWMGIGAFGGAIGMFVSGLAVAKFGNYNAAITQIALAAVVGFILALLLVRPKRWALDG
jgi:MFS family permease